jgi:rhodanese-related sulfurtransferase
MQIHLIACRLVAFMTMFAVSAAVGQEPISQPGQQVPARKQTTLGLYVTAKQAYEKWQAAPETVKILDIRTPEEFIFVGHPAMAWNIPFAVQTYEWDPSRQYFAMKPDPAFVSRVKQSFSADDTLLVMCRSGDRGAMAVNLLAEAGFKNTYNVIDGMEGDLVKDPESDYDGKRMKNGWKNSGCPWTYALNPEQMRVPK